MGASSALSSTVVMMAVGEVGASAGMGCSLGAMEVVLAMGEVTGEGSSDIETAGVGAAVGAGAGVGRVTPASAARDSKRGHQLFSTS